MWHWAVYTIQYHSQAIFCRLIIKCCISRGPVNFFQHNYQRRILNWVPMVHLTFVSASSAIDDNSFDNLTKHRHLTFSCFTWMFNTLLLSQGYFQVWFYVPVWLSFLLLQNGHLTALGNYCTCKDTNGNHKKVTVWSAMEMQDARIQTFKLSKSHLNFFLFIQNSLWRHIPHVWQQTKMGYVLR